MVMLMDTYELLDELSKFGLTEAQAKAYYTLLKLGRTSYAKISVEMGVHRSEVYRILRELKEKGIVSEKRGRPILFIPMPPKEAIDALLKMQMEKVEYLKKAMTKMVDKLESQVSASARPSVLLIDDDRSAAKNLSHLLETNGCDVDIAGDGSEALKKIRKKTYHIALIDVLLPDIMGTKLLRKLKNENPDIKEIIITGYPSIKNAIEALNEGADGYILKPIAPPELLAKIRESLKEICALHFD